MLKHIAATAAIALSLASAAHAQSAPAELSTQGKLKKVSISNLSPATLSITSNTYLDGSTIAPGQTRTWNKVGKTDVWIDFTGSSSVCKAVLLNGTLKNFGCIGGASLRTGQYTNGEYFAIFRAQ